jgi:hypothetical protein
MKRILGLNVEKIKELLKVLDRNISWLARKSGVGRQWLHYDMKTGCTNRIDKYASVFNIEIQDLIK